MKIQVILGSTRQNRFSEKPGRWIAGLLKAKEGVEAELLDLRDYPLPFYDEAVPPSMLKGNYSNEISKKWAAKIGEGDGYIIVTPEYNHGYPGVLKNALDTVFAEWNNKPVGFVSYGGVMGARSVEQLRLVAIELHLVPIEATLSIPVQTFRDASARKEGDVSDLFEPMKPFADKFIDQVIWWANALRSHA
ncbi:MAG TPA: NAD(P)H-dependent oxidoreductase [Candidatus Omnitrophota bacterium]|nr:NAD(P)H-dependent oxidoreductase [Candidatus Omnitrophota bacterium]